ncbi:MAG: thiamine phosphate synthase, partial [Pseudomonadota bacterium]
VAQCRKRLRDDAVIGVSCHSSQEAETAQALGADYITMSPVFLTESKPGYGPALGPDRLGEITRALDLPVLGLGGIDAETVPDIRNSGAAGFAVMGGIMRADDPMAAVERLAAAWNG